jgi:hypothetical protein
MQELASWMGEWQWVAGIAGFFLLLAIGLWLKSRFDDGSGRWNTGD